MLYVVVLGCILVGINIAFSYLEILPFIDAVKADITRAQQTRFPITRFFRYILLPFKSFSHILLLLPTLIDFAAMAVLTGTFGLGGGLAGGLTGLFASNLVSTIVFCNTHNLSFFKAIWYIIKFVFSGFKVQTIEH